MNGDILMGAIIRLDKVPSNCRVCIFANDDISYCKLRNSKIIAGDIRSNRMPLCPIINEGKYLSKILSRIGGSKLFKIKSYY